MRLPCHLMPQRFEQSSSFTVFPLDQHHFQMQFAPGNFLNLHAVALEALITIDHSDHSLCGLEGEYWGRCVTFPFTLTERLAKAALYYAHRAIIVHLI